MTTNFFSPLSFVAVFGSGMGKNQDPGSATLTSGLSDDDGKNDGLKWKLAESVRQRNNIFTASPLSAFCGGILWLSLSEGRA